MYKNIDRKEFAKLMRTEAVGEHGYIHVSDELWEQIAEMIENSVEVVLCKDCKHFIKEEHGCEHHGHFYPVHVKDYDFCSYGERREGE